MELKSFYFIDFLFKHFFDDIANAIMLVFMLQMFIWRFSFSKKATDLHCGMASCSKNLVLNVLNRFFMAFLCVSTRWPLHFSILYEFFALRMRFNFLWWECKHIVVIASTMKRECWLVLKSIYINDNVFSTAAAFK